jgi:hypothetical protein
MCVQEKKSQETQSAEGKTTTCGVALLEDLITQAEKIPEP